MLQVPYWLSSFERSASYSYDPAFTFTETGDSTTGILTHFLGDPAGYIDPIWFQFLKKRAREWLIKVDIDGVEYDMSQIVDINIENDIVPGNEFELGTAIISRLVLRLKTMDEIAPNAKVIPYVALSLAGMTWDDADYAWQDADFAWDGSSTTEWLPLGTFYVDNRKQDRMIWTFECFDGLTFADIAYVSQLTYPTTMQAVWDEVCAQAGLLYDSSVQIDPGHTLNAGPAGYTCRQVLSYIAGAHGASVKMSRSGELTWRTYAADESPVYEMTEADYVRVKQTNPVKTYTRVVVTYDEDDGLYYEAGEGDDNHTLYLTNPLMTQAMVDALHAQINGFSYVPIEMDARGYPQMEHGDRITYYRSESLAWADANMIWDEADFRWDGIKTYQSIILRQTFTFRGGLKMTIDAPSVSEQESEFGIDGTLTAAVNRLNQNALRYGKPYYGVSHSRDEGIVVQREDGLAKAVFNADELSFYADGEQALWFDVPNKKFRFSGTLEAVDGIFSGDLQAAGGTFTGTLEGVDGIFSGNLQAAGGTFTGTLEGVDGTFSGTVQAGTIQGGFVIGAAIIGGVITGSTLQTASPGTYPRAALDSINSEMAFYADATRWVKFGAWGESGNPFLQFANSDGVISIYKSGSTLLHLGDVAFLDELSVDFSDLIDRYTGSNFWSYYGNLLTEIGGKADAFTGLTGLFPLGGGLTGRFLNGVLQETF